jgi:hypothetical protein
MQHIDRTMKSRSRSVSRFSTAACSISLGIVGLSGLAIIGTDGWVARSIDNRLESVAERWQGSDGIKRIASGDESFWLKRHPDVLPAMFQDNGKSFAVGEHITIGGNNGSPSKIFEIVDFTPIHPELSSIAPTRALRLVTAKETGAGASGAILRFVIEADLSTQQSTVGVTKPASTNKAL